MDSLVGTRLGKYDILAEIGRGGIGVVYRGRDPDLDRDVAIKVLNPQLVEQEEVVKRFWREARQIARLKHPNIVAVYDVGQQDAWVYFVMEFVEGQTLAQIIHERAPLPLAETLSMLCPLALALDYAHSQQLVHRDVKPANVIIGPTGHVTLTDFGVVHVPYETQLTIKGTMVGTPRYMSPEQVRGIEVGPASDQYSLAVVSFEMLSGQVPFQVDNPAAMLYKIVHERTPPIAQLHPGLPAQVGSVLDRALAKDPQDRYPSATAFAAALGQAIVAETADEKTLAALQSVTPIGVQLPARPARRRRPAWGWALGVLAAAVVLFLGLRQLLSGALAGQLDGPATPSVAQGSLGTDQPAWTGEAITRANAMGVELVYVPAGEFRMGAEFGEPYEQPVHIVYLDGFWIDQTEVTNDQFAAFVAATGHRTEAERMDASYTYGPQGRLLTPGATWRHPQGPESTIEGLGDHPVVQVSWNDAVAFCQWRGARLPTEAEWEKAARGEAGFKFPWGNAFNRDNLNYCDFNCPFDWRIRAVDDGFRYTARVGSYPAGASPYGALDMAGNVHEWVADWYDAGYYARSERDNPTGPDSGEKRAARGSSWNDIEWYIRSTDRYAFLPTYAGDETGFRCARNDAPQ